MLGIHIKKANKKSLQQKHIKKSIYEKGRICFGLHIKKANKKMNPKKFLGDI